MGRESRAMEGLTMDISPAQQSRAKTASKGGWLRLAIGCGLSLLCLYFVFRNIKLDEISQSIRGFRWPLLIAGVASLAVGYTARIYRWKMLLAACGPNVSTRACAAPFLSSIALNNVLPFRLGDVVRALVFPKALGVTRTGATATLVLERLVDLLTLLICLGIATSFFPRGALPPAIVDTVVALAFVGSLALLLLILFTGALVKLLRWIMSLLEGRAPPRLTQAMSAIVELAAALNSISRLRTVGAALAISFVAWAGELGLYLSVMSGIHMPFSLPGGLLLMSMATIATLVPSSPGYVGPYHLAAFTAAHLMGETPTQAMALAVLCHLGIWLPTTIAGALFMLFNRNLFKAARSQADRDAGEPHE